MSGVTSASGVTPIYPIGERERANLVVRTARISYDRNCACSRITRFFLSENISNFHVRKSWKDQSREDALRRRRERQRERHARETPEQRETRLYQRRLRDGELPSCHIDAKSSHSRLFAGIRCALERGCIYTSLRSSWF